MATNLMGIDVGFSKTRQSTGIACLDDSHQTQRRGQFGLSMREAVGRLGEKLSGEQKKGVEDAIKDVRERLNGTDPDAISKGRLHSI
jgi:hypothetical protein